MEKVKHAFFRFRLMFTVLAFSSVKCLQGNFQFLKNVKNTSPLSQTGQAWNFVIWCCDVLKKIQKRGQAWKKL